jgi:hypothetical protein
MNVSNQLACPWQDPPAKSNVWGKGRSQPERSTFQVLHSMVGSWLTYNHSTTLERPAKDKFTRLIGSFINYIIVFKAQCYKIFLSVIYEFSRLYLKILPRTNTLTYYENSWNLNSIGFNNIIPCYLKCSQGCTSLPVKGFTRVGTNLACKFWTKVEATGNDKRTSLLQHIITSVKSLYYWPMEAIPARYFGLNFFTHFNNLDHFGALEKLWTIMK